MRMSKNINNLFFLLYSWSVLAFKSNHKIVFFKMVVFILEAQQEVYQTMLMR